MGRQSSIEASQDILPELYAAHHLPPEQNRTALYVAPRYVRVRSVAPFRLYKDRAQVIPAHPLPRNDDIVSFAKNSCSIDTQVQT
jgi:hypothetical protein